MDREELYSDKITKGSRTYFFDIKKSESGDLYLKISESKKTTSGFEHHRLMIFNEDLKDFVETTSKVLLKRVYLSKKQFVWNLEMGLASLLLCGLDELTLYAIIYETFTNYSFDFLDF